MKVLVRLLFLASAIALGFWTWNVLFTNPKSAIRNRLMGILVTHANRVAPVIDAIVSR